MKKYINNFLLMLQFLTRIPVNKNLPCELEDFRRGSAFLPIVGLIIGTIQWFVYFVFIRILPGNVVTVLIIITGILITGGLHIDGLGDTCDGFYAFKGRERIIEIMKDSRIGTYACLAIICDILIRYSALYSIILKGNAVFIIVMPVIGRFALVAISFIGKTAKSTGSGNLFIGNVNKTIVAIVSILTAAICMSLIGIIPAISILITAVLLCFLVNKYCNFKVGGLTGDTLGANNEIVEIVSLIIFIIIKNKFKI